MEKTQLDEHRSLEIIRTMIADTSAHIDRTSGKYFLLWGYTTVIVSLFEYFVQLYLCNVQLALWAWFTIPVVGGIGTLLLNRHSEQRPKSYVDRSISSVWSVLGFSWGLMFVAALAYGANILFLTVVLMGMGTVITGKICQHKVLTASGKAAIILSLIFPAHRLLISEYGTALHDSDTECFKAVIFSEIIIFALIFVVMMIIPGHILSKRAKKQHNA